MKKQYVACNTLELDRLPPDLQSSDEAIRAKAVRAIGPCRAGWQLFEQCMDIVEKLTKDPSPTVRALALHVFEDASEMDSSGYPTSCRQITNDMARKKRLSRFPADEEEISAARKAKDEGHRRHHNTRG